jgi:hypothetical protein
VFLEKEVYMRRLILLFLGIVPFFAALTIQLIVLSVLELVILVITGISVLSSEMSYYLSVISVIICGLIFFYWYQKLTRLRSTENLRKTLTPQNLLPLVALGITSQFMISGILSILKPFLEELFKGYSDVVNKIFSGEITVVVLYIVLFAPIVEELIFRGVMLTKLLPVLPFFAANILQAAIFGIYHWNIIQGVYAFGIGLLFGYVSHRFRSLAASILLHMAINSTAFLVVLVPETKAAFILSTAVGTILTVGLLLLLTRRTGKEHNPSDVA